MRPRRISIALAMSASVAAHLAAAALLSNSKEACAFRFRSLRPIPMQCPASL